MCKKDKCFIIGLLLLGSLFFGSCVKEYVYGDSDFHSSVIEKNDSSTDKKTIKITFSAAINQNKAATRSDDDDDNPIPLPKGCYAHIYVYQFGDYPGFNKWTYMGIYRAPEDGRLSELYNTMELTEGIYNFYATSAYDFDTDQGPNFNQYTGVATNLYNGVDYLWWKDENVIVKNDDQVVPIVFNRCCAKLTFEFDAASGYVLDSISHCDVTTGLASQCSFSLRTGKITPATTVSTSKQMCTINGDEASTIILPLTTWKNLTATIAATVDGSLGWYTLSVPLKYTDTYRGGYEYIYKLEFDGSSSN